MVPLGAPTTRILLRTVLPNIAGPVLVQFSLAVAAAVVLESGLSFLGLGVVPPTPSWGLMIRGARSTMEHAPLLLVWPCVALTITMVIKTGKKCLSGPIPIALFAAAFVLNGLLRWPLLISLAILAPLSLIWAWPRDRAAEPA